MAFTADGKIMGFGWAGVDRPSGEGLRRTWEMKGRVAAMKRVIGKGAVLAAIMGALTFQTGFAAYIDPNTGGMLFQLLAVLFGVFSGLVLLFSSRLKQVFFRARRKVSGSKAEAEEEEHPVDAGGE
jgi:hypothetical protein